jgi:hypothetical protein
MFWFSPRRQKPRHNQRVIAPSSDLWDLVLDMDWPGVISHVEEHPCDAEWTDGHWHETPLYLACQHNPPLEAIKAIVEAYPRALLSPSRANKDLPIHIACRYQVNEAILQELLKDFPVTAVEQTRWGRTPVMALWEFRPKEDEDGSQSESSSSVDETLWRKIFVVLEAVARFREHPLYQNQTPRTRKREFRGPYSTKQPIKASCFNPEEASIVHAAVSLGSLSCPVEVLDHVLRKFPEQAFLRDQWDQLPLHIVVGPTTCNPSTRRQYKPREQQFISLLLEANCGAATEPIHSDHDRYPLHTALSNRHTWSGGIECLFRAAPEILLMPDPLSKLYPFQLAAIPVRDNHVNLDTIYMLLRSQPDVLALMDLSSRPKNHSVTLRSKRRTTRGFDHCPRGIEDALMGTIAAISIGSVAGIVFGHSL